jgi:hypothetical protein
MTAKLVADPISLAWMASTPLQPLNRQEVHSELPRQLQSYLFLDALSEAQVSTPQAGRM